MKLSKSIFNSIFLVSIFSILLVSAFFILFQFNNFNKDKKNLKEDYIERKKILLKKEVLLVYNYIQYQEKRKNLELRKKLKQQVEQAYTTILNIYEENKDKLSEDEIKYLIVQVLKNITFKNKRQYFFINTNSGQAILYNKNLYLDTNKNLWDLQDLKGQYFIRKQSKIALSEGSGFIKIYFAKANNKQDPKLSYIKNFKPFNWHIGMGEYLDDFTYELKQDILEYIASIRFDKNGYIFINSIDKKALVFDGRKLAIAKTYPNDKLFKKQLNAIKNKNGDFFFYKFKKLNGQKKFPKLAYVKLYENWGWIIGSGIYIDEIDTQLAKKDNQLTMVIKEELLIIFIFLIFTIILIYILSKSLSLKLINNLELLSVSFDKASKNFTIIDSSKFSIKEFKYFSNSLNKVLVQRNNTQKKLKNYLNLVNNHVITSTTDEKGIITNVSEAFCKISGYSKKELIGKSHNIVKHEDMPDELYKDLWQTIKSGKIWKGEIKNKKKNADSYWVDVVIEPILQDSVIVGYTAIRHDITDKKKVEYLSITDELSGLYNRRFFNQKIENEINRAKREDNYLSLMIIDVDFFKKYNDTYGHMLGDSAIKNLSDVLISMVNRSSDFAFRLGGEEFGIIISQKDKDSAFLYANKIKEKIEQLHIEHRLNKSSKYLTVSIGIITKKAIEIKSSSELYSLADEALYLSKKNGRNQVTSMNL
ncbi:MAG: cache domain-containing protein [Halarcobacter sp.]